MSQTTLVEALATAPANLRPALDWFHDHRNEEIGWPSPSPVEGSNHVVTQAKGIYKPAGSAVALTVRQTLESSYADRAPVTRPDGSWVYAYHQEGSDPAARDSDYTNVALMENIKTGSPVAVLLQTKGKPGVRYRVLGLAVATRWDAGFFYLEGFNDAGIALTSGTASEDLVIAEEALRLVEGDGVGALAPEHDARVWAAAAVVRRSGQELFRRQLLSAYGGRCAVTGCDVIAVLDAAHIQPYRGAHTDVLSNGLLLRTDLHNLFDRGLSAVDPATRTVVLAEVLRDGHYDHLRGVEVAEPAKVEERPAMSALAAHLAWCGDRLS